MFLVLFVTSLNVGRICIRLEYYVSVLVYCAYQQLMDVTNLEERVKQPIHMELRDVTLLFIV